MSGIMIVGGLAALVLLALGRRDPSTLGKVERKAYVEKQIDELAANEKWLPDWERTDSLLNEFTQAIKNQLPTGDGVIVTSNGIDLGQAALGILNWALDKLAHSARHYCYFKAETLDALGAVLAVKPNAPIIGAVSTKIVTVTRQDRGPVDAVLAAYRQTLTPFVLYNVAGQRPQGDLPAGEYYAFAPLGFRAGATAASLTGAALANGNNLRSNLAPLGFIVSDPLVIVTKESLIARVDP